MSHGNKVSSKLLKTSSKSSQWRVELHCHSEYSRDCTVPLRTIIDLCKERGINAIALTDHDEIAGAVELQKIAPSWLTVIVGEEIRSSDGDIIGLFLKSKIRPGLSAVATIKQINAQGGVVLLPHPFDRIRHEALGKTTTDKVKSKIDFIEIFNARCVINQDNEASARYAKENSLYGYAGSDAHTRSEYGRAVNTMKPFATKTEFIQNLRRATFDCQKSHPIVHLQTLGVKLQKRLHN